MMVLILLAGRGMLTWTLHRRTNINMISGKQGGIRWQGKVKEALSNEGGKGERKREPFCSRNPTC